jgi:hypothetical protein
MTMPTTSNAPVRLITKGSGRYRSINSKHIICHDGRTRHHRRWFVTDLDGNRVAPYSEVKGSPGVDGIVQGYNALALACEALAVLISEERTMRRVMDACHRRGT